MIFIEATHSEPHRLKVSLESLLIIYIYKICDKNNLNLYVVYKECLQEPLFTVNISDIDFKFCSMLNIPKVASFCVWPIVVIGNDVTAGLCSVARRIIKCSTNEKCKLLLGFKDACLLACSETSVWTKFCEIDIPSTIKDVLLNPSKYFEHNSLNLPVDLLKFEYHMQQPVKMHNIYKIARQKTCNKSLKSSVPIENLNLDHIYGEGLYMTLADILLYPSIKTLLNLFGIETIETSLPLCVAWYRNITTLDLVNFDFRYESEISYEGIHKVILPEIPKHTLYISSPTRNRGLNHVYTKQLDIENCLSIISKSKVNIVNSILPFGYEIEFDWSTIPLDANPEGGALPKTRSGRKCEQLENIAKAVIKIVKSQKLVIVDFCSGSGHLGLLLATLLPSCDIILVENKEKSLERARQRIEKLNLENVHITQCNLDYFSAKFDIGVALHACGVATDLVIQQCLDNKANFICCPCCYGGIHDCHHLKYPRSILFKTDNITKKDYLNIAHAADQTHDEQNAKTKQGFFCMDIIDNDRKLAAEEHGYTVHLGKLQPPSCTPKNNLLVGLYQAPSD